MGFPLTGSVPHLATELFKMRTGTDFTHVPYKGGGPGADLVAGHIGVMFASPIEVSQHVAAGTLHCPRTRAVGAGRQGVRREDRIGFRPPMATSLARPNILWYCADQVHRNGNAYFPPHEKLVTRMFADAGYDCGLIGKLHLSAAKNFETRPDDGYRAFYWRHHPTPDAARGHDYDSWLRHAPPEKLDRVKYHLDAMMGTIGIGPPRFANY